MARLELRRKKVPAAEHSRDRGADDHTLNAEGPARVASEALNSSSPMPLAQAHVANGSSFGHHFGGISPTYPPPDNTTSERIESAAAHGEQLTIGARRRLESRFGVDLSTVRVHTNGQADQLTRALGAAAFATGSNIFFRNGAYNPRTADGMYLLTHEVTHVLQQRGRALVDTPHPSGVLVDPLSDPLETEAEAVARSVVTYRPDIGSPRCNVPTARSLSAPHTAKDTSPSLHVQRTPIELHTPGRGGNIQLTVWGKVFDERGLEMVPLTRQFTGGTAFLDVPAGRQLLVQLFLAAQLPGASSAQRAWLNCPVSADPHSGRFTFGRCTPTIWGSDPAAFFALDQNQFRPEVNPDSGELSVTASFSPTTVQETSGSETSGELQFQTPRSRILPVPSGQTTLRRSQSSQTQITRPTTAPVQGLLLRLRATNLLPPEVRAAPALRTPIWLHTHDLRRSVHFGRRGAIEPVAFESQISNLTAWRDMLRGNPDDPSNIWKALTEGGLRLNLEAFASPAERSRGANLNVSQGRGNWLRQRVGDLFPSVSLTAPLTNSYPPNASPNSEPDYWRADVWIIERDAVDSVQQWLQRVGREPQTR